MKIANANIYRTSGLQFHLFSRIRLREEQPFAGLESFPDIGNCIDNGLEFVDDFNDLFCDVLDDCEDFKDFASKLFKCVSNFRDKLFEAKIAKSVKKICQFTRCLGRVLEWFCASFESVCCEIND